MKLILIGAGNRGLDVYAKHLKTHHPEIEFVGVADPSEHQQSRFKALFSHNYVKTYNSWETILKEPKFADAAIIATQDDMHFEPTMKALAQGYHVLLEKPISGNKDELIKLREYAKAQNKILSIAHVLRYSSFFATIKSLLNQGKIGHIRSIQHQENIGFYHYAHSFVRGPWHDSNKSNPIILAKACHDMDIIAWYVESKCTRVSSFAIQNTLTKDNKPIGATKRCTDGCPHQDTCVYFAPRLYQTTKAEHLKNILENQFGSLNRALATSDYGRCVYDMENNVMETQVTLLQFENGVQVSFHLSAFSDEISRYIHIMGTEGEIRANTIDNQIIVKRFDQEYDEIIELKEFDSAHQGGDAGIVRGFVQEVQNSEIENGRTTIDKSIMSHLMALAAEESRKTNKIIHMDEFEKEGHH